MLQGIVALLDILWKRLKKITKLVLVDYVTLFVTFDSATLGNLSHAKAVSSIFLP